MTLTEFLLARIAEDQAVAQMRQERGASGVPSAMSVTYGHTHFVEDPSSPARVLAECEAKRRIMALHAKGEAWCDHCDGYGGPESCDTCPTIQLLALPYADHPDYNPDWKGQAVI